MKKALISAMTAAVMMASAAAIAMAITPTRKIVDFLPKLDLEASIPKQFGEWKMDERTVGGVVNPQQTEMLNKLYSQVLSRTYYNEKGYRIMLSIAYGEDQRDSNQLHYPEVCYPAQGFQITSRQASELDISGRKIQIRRLESHLSKQRYEPITYWTTVGERVVTGKIQKKIAEMGYGFKGEIPDGLLFRVSSIDIDSARAFEVHGQFVDQLSEVVTQPNFSRIFGAK